MKWQIASPQSLHLKIWENEGVVYDSQSGHTHLLANDAVQILEVLMQEPRDVATLSQLLAPTPAFASPVEESLDRIAAILADLAGISLISPTP